MLVVPADVRERDPLHEALELIAAARAQHQVPVIAHEAPAQQLDAEALQPLGQHVEKRLKILGLAKDPPPAVAAVDHVVDRIDFAKARGTWHEMKLMESRPSVK